jgi:hypothetical protein
MGVVDRKQELFGNIARLRRVAREVPWSRDLAEVRIALERELGETVSRRLAARVLGVSHSALDRWIEAGDLAVVYTPEGRLEVPVPELLDLCEAVDAEKAAGGGGRFVLTATMERRRDAARGMRIDDSHEGEELRGHDRARARSLAYHRVVAGRLSAPIVQEARHVLLRWREQGSIDPRYADRWEQLLSGSVPEIRRRLVEVSPDADDLRQSSPFAGMLSEPERRRIVSEVA